VRSIQVDRQRVLTGDYRWSQPVWTDDSYLRGLQVITTCLDRRFILTGDYRWSQPVWADDSYLPEITGDHSLFGQMIHTYRRLQVITACLDRRFIITGDYRWTQPAWTDDPYFPGITEDYRGFIQHAWENSPYLPGITGDSFNMLGQTVHTKWGLQGIHSTCLDKQCILTGDYRWSHTAWTNS
jgi:hypothetical protein